MPGLPDTKSIAPPYTNDKCLASSSSTRYCQVADRLLQVGKKSTKSEKEFRVATVYGMLVDGRSRTEILQFSAETWQISERTGDQYIADARDRLFNDAQITREALLAEALAGYRSIRQQAERRGQLMVAKSCLDATLAVVGVKA